MDDIWRRLELIDRQLARRPANFPRQIISTAPLLFTAVGLITGILIQNTFDLSILLWLSLLASFTLAAVIIFALNKIIPYAPTHLCFCALICFACLGAIRLADFHQAEPNDICNFVTGERKLATIRGLIVTDPYTQKPQWQFAKFKFTDPTSSFYLKVNELKTIDGWAKATGTVRVQVSQPIMDLKAGDNIQIYCWLDTFKPAPNPGQFDVAQYLARKNIFIAASVQSRDAIELLENNPAGTFTKITGIFTKIKRKAREIATHALVGELHPEEPDRGLLEALLLGYRSNIDSDTYRAFHKTGLLHFISLSGLHLGILIGIIWWLCKTAGLLKPGRAIICIIAIAVFLFIVPSRAPTVRAAIIGWVFCASLLFGRKHSSVNALSLAAIILLLIRPTQLFEAGWQLSFVAVLGLVLFCKRIHSLLYETITSLPWAEKIPMTKPFVRIVSRPGPYLLALFSTGLTAWLSSAGILLYHFHTINPLTCVWTIIAFPFVAAILTFGYLKMVLFFLLPTASTFLGIIVTALSSWLIWIVKLLAHLDFSHILIGRVSLMPVVFYYCIVALIAFTHFRRPVIKKLICITAAFAIVVFIGTVKYRQTHRDNLVLTCLDVGHGQAIVAQLPGRTNCLFDAGSMHNSDIGRRIVTPFLNYNGTNKIDHIFISHSDIDHINAIPEIVEDCNVKNIYADFFNEKSLSATEKCLFEYLAEKGITPSEELNIKSRATVKILWPSEQARLDKTLNDNDKSTVSLIEFAGNKILLCSDIEDFAQKEFLRLYPNLKADVVIVPHHGSVATLDSRFLEKLQPHILICSCSRSAYEKQQVITQKDKSEVFYTATDGAVTIHITKDGTIKTTTFTQSR